jgi:hypothetical protein
VASLLKISKGLPIPEIPQLVGVFPLIIYYSMSLTSEMRITGRRVAEKPLILINWLLFKSTDFSLKKVDF